MAVRVIDSNGNSINIAGRGRPGAPGADGKSAYQYAVDGGYTGTEEEFQALIGSGPWVPEAGFVPASNPNLLYNWYLKDPINQRGKTEYRGAVYGADGWKNMGSHNEQRLESDGITVGRISGNTNSGSKNISQSVENWEWMAGKTFTASALVSRATGYAYMLLMHGDSTNTYVSINGSGEGPFLLKKTFTFPAEMHGLRFLLRSPSSAEDISATFAAAKLGSEQTLAHQDADRNWVLNDPPPNKALELEKCQRYFQIFSTQEKRPVLAEDFRPVMRINPALTTMEINGGTWYVADANL